MEVKSNEMKRLTEHEINEIRERANLREIIATYLPLTQKGQNYWAVCPFHNDHDPSLSISESKQIYKCFVCGAGGNAFTFVKDYENISFIEAVVKVASTIGLDLSDTIITDAQVVDPVQQESYEMMEQANEFYKYQLKTTNNPQVKSFLEKRELKQDVIDTFELGLSLSSTSLVRFLTSKGFDPQQLTKVDLANRFDDQFRDVFYDRILFPIHNRKGKVVAFTARALYDNNDVKYINTSGTPIYTKGDVLYNMHRIDQREYKQQSLVICEGVMDVIAFHQAGHGRTIAPLGTALTDKQAQMIKQINAPVVLAYDRDNAGIKATYQIGSKLFEMSVNVAVYHNTTTLDPDDYLKQKGKQALLDTITKAKHWIEFVMEYGSTLYSLQSYQNRKDFVQFVFKHLARVSVFDQTYFINQLAELTQFSTIDLHNQLAEISVKPVEVKREIRPSSQNQISTNSLLSSEKEILSLIIKSKKAAYQFRDSLGYLINKEANGLALIILESYTHQDDIVIADLLNKQLTPIQTSILIELADDNTLSDEDIEKILDDDIVHIQIEAINQQVLMLEKKSRNELDTNAKIELGLKITKLIQQKDQLLDQGEKL